MMKETLQNENENKDNCKNLLKTLRRSECSNDLRERNDLSTRHQLLCPANQEM